jgi:hypothetical protein
VGPVLEDDVGGDGPQMLEEAIHRAACDDGGSPGEDAEISGGVEREGQQVEGDQNAGEGFLAVAKVVFEIVSIGLQHVEGLVLDPRLRGDKPSTVRVRRRLVRRRRRT